MKMWLACVLAGSLVMGCSTIVNKEAKKEQEAQKAEPPVFTHKVETGPSPQAKEAAIKSGDDLVSEITYRKGSSELTPEARTKLTNLLQTAEKNGTIKSVDVVAWADYEYPSKEKKKLSRRETALAKKRASVLQDYIQEVVKKDQKEKFKLTAFNMAERPTKLGSFIHDRDARMKKTLEASGIPTTGDTPEKQTPKASKSFVMVKLEGSKK